MMHHHVHIARRCWQFWLLQLIVVTTVPTLVVVVRGFQLAPAIVPQTSSQSSSSSSSKTPTTRTTRRCQPINQHQRRRASSTTTALFSTATPQPSSTDNEESSSSSTQKGTTTTTYNVRKKQKKIPPLSWFPRRIQDTLDYHAIVQRLYVRHIVTETRDMADFVLQQYTQRLSGVGGEKEEGGRDHEADPFATLARQLSACSATRSEGGKIGWIERTSSQYEILPQSVVTHLFELQPKAGDVIIVPSSPTSSTRTPAQWHTIQVMELWTDLPLMTIHQQQQQQEEEASVSELPVGSHSGQNVWLQGRKKLPGQGVMPQVVNLDQLSTYTIQTAGCQMNVADSERLEGVLQHQLGLERVDDKNKNADVVLFNTCSIRDHAEQKLYDVLGPWAALKRRGERPNLVLVVTGCVAQQEGQALLRRIPELDVVLGPQHIPHLATIMQKVATERSQIVVTQPMFVQQQHETTTHKLDHAVSDDFHSRPVRGHSVRAWVNVIFGCNEHCTYCVVPATRGMEQSRSMEAILHECLDLAKAGYKEVTLLGQNIDAYGRDMVPKRTFSDLLAFLNARIRQKMRIRYVTSHPRYFSDRVIDAVANLDKVCECFHVPFQAGDDDVLRAMRRGYTFDSYMRIIDKIRQAAPDAAICGDVIVGFPGETDEAFEKTLELMRRVKFDNLNTFSYSPRPNTEAALWDELQVPEHVKAERLQRVQQLAAEHGLERSRRYLGRTVEVLVEDANPRNPQRQAMGRTRQGRQVYFDVDVPLDDDDNTDNDKDNGAGAVHMHNNTISSVEQWKGEFVQVRITEARTWSLMGEMVMVADDANAS